MISLGGGWKRPPLLSLAARLPDCMTETAALPVNKINNIILCTKHVLYHFFEVYDYTHIYALLQLYLAGSAKRRQINIYPMSGHTATLACLRASADVRPSVRQHSRIVA
jgi:hypothetical protein